MPLILPNSIINNTPADASPVDQNYQFIASYINTNVITRDGAVAMTAQLKLVGDPVNPTDAASKGYVDAILPVGSMVLFGGQVAPAGRWALCNGASLAVASYPQLYAVLGVRYGGTGGTFQVPNMRGRFAIGMDTAQPEFSATGKYGGTFTVPVPLHSHPMAHTHEHPHTHTMPHTHTINHDHPQINTSNPLQGHRHDLSMRQTNAPGSTGSAMQAGTAGTTTGQFTGNDDTVHQHAVNIPPYVGPSGASSAASTGAVSEATTGGSSAASTSNAGVSGVEMQPPFITVNYIIRVD